MGVPRNLYAKMSLKVGPVRSQLFIEASINKSSIIDLNGFIKTDESVKMWPVEMVFPCMSFKSTEDAKSVRVVSSES